ncbi:MAG: thiamine-phosphate kinase [Planctomycetota bacterium]|nr:thiamine-phosphate kinase [Planctomycetota bacterium]
MTWQEKDLLNNFRRRALEDDSVIVGPGDDCAVVRYGSETVVLTTDMIVDGVDFRLDEHDPFDIGWKAVTISASDVAAMCFVPAHFVVSSALPELSDEQIQRLYDGLYAACAECGASLVGGDISSGARLALVSSATGISAGTHPVLRSGARPGDVLMVTGPLGGSILGRHLRCSARLDAVRALAEHGPPAACMDLSDGLSGDLASLADASKVGFEVFGHMVPVHDDAVILSKNSGEPELFHALNDGEDFELLVAVARTKAEGLVRACNESGVHLYKVGRVLPAQEGRWLVMGSDRHEWKVRSYEHGS